MPKLYVQLDVNFQDDDRLLDVSADAELMFVRSLALCKRLLNDGKVTAGQARRLGDKVSDWRDAAGQLVRVGLWQEDGDGYIVPSWTKHNRSAAEIEDAVEAKLQGAARGNHNRWHRDRNEVDPSCEFCRSDSESVSESHSETVSESGANPQSRDRVETETEGNPLPSDDGDEAEQQFEEHFWPAYPPTNGRKPEKAKALVQWRKLTLEQRRRALIGARNLARSDTVPKYAQRFLRRDSAGAFPFDDWQTSGGVSGPQSEFEGGARILDDEDVA